MRNLCIFMLTKTNNCICSKSKNTNYANCSYDLYHHSNPFNFSISSSICCFLMLITFNSTKDKSTPQTAISSLIVAFRSKLSKWSKSLYKTVKLPVKVAIITTNKFLLSSLNVVISSLILSCVSFFKNTPMKG